jgi:hypothetical protein
MHDSSISVGDDLVVLGSNHTLVEVCTSQRKRSLASLN